MHLRHATCKSLHSHKYAAFIDPFFSSGIHLAFTSALSAAATICAVLKGDCDKLDAAEWHTKRVATSYTRFDALVTDSGFTYLRFAFCRFQIVVLSAYKQIRAQNADVLSDVDEDNYDRAFTLLRPGRFLILIFVSTSCEDRS